MVSWPLESYRAVSQGCKITKNRIIFERVGEILIEVRAGDHG